MTRPTDPNQPSDAVEPAQRASDDLAAAPAGIAAEVSRDLGGLAERPVDEHPEIYESVHQRLGDTLSGIDHV